MLTYSLARTLLLSSFFWLGLLASAQPSPDIVVPQLGAFSSRAATDRPVVTAVDAGVVIREQSAVTTLDISLHNPYRRRSEAEVWIPLPHGVVIRSFSFQGSSAEPAVKLLSRDEAAATYGAITARLKDPALLEFARYGMARSTVFPIEAGQNQKVRLTYEHLLPINGARVDYELLKSESIGYRAPWKISVRMKSLRPLSTAYSPSHKIELKREDDSTLSIRTTPESESEPGPFRVSFLFAAQGVSSTLYAAPDDRPAGGYFLLLAGPPPELASRHNATAIRREVTLVLDRSGSMQGEKIRQVKQAARQTISALAPNEFFNLVIYSDSVQVYSPRPVERTPANLAAALSFVDSIEAGGGTNLHGALSEALRLPSVEGALPVMLFLTDGLPTVGNTSETDIRAVATAQNARHRRVFAFGVGADVNAPLLDRISSENRGVSTYVLPGESAEAKVGEVFARLAGPVLADPHLEVLGADGNPDHGRIIDVLPARLPDIFQGDQLVVLGRYNDDRPMTIRISGNFNGRPASFTQKFEMDRKTDRNSFVARLWASRRIGLLIDELRQMGADSAMARPADFAANARLSSLSAAPMLPSAPVDPRFQELVGEVVRLSTRFGIMTEYTAFLATEGCDLTKPDAVLAQAASAFRDRALATRTGFGALNQSLNNNVQRSQAVLNNRNSFLTADMKQSSVTAVQQASDLTFYAKDGRWVDSRIYNSLRPVKPARSVTVGTPQYLALAAELSTEGRGGFATLKGDVVVLVHGEQVLIESR